jgi:diguanylate cyclase (GGDEF)-like protein/PAS domain S-box-containing protein
MNNIPLTLETTPARDSLVALRSAASVLIVDDNSAKRLALSAVLTPLGYPIVQAESGQSALRCLMSNDFAVILLDVCMPIMDGFETAALIRQRRQSEMTPIIFITAFGASDVVTADRYAEGAVDFIFAPVDPSELRAKVTVFANLFIKAAELAAKTAEAQKAANQLQSLTDAAPIGIFQTDAENCYVYTNPRWSEITGIRSEDAVGMLWDVVVDPEQRESLGVVLANSVANGTELRHRVELKREGSAPRTVLLSSVSIPGTGATPAGWVGTVADMTIEAGKELARSAARDEVAAASQLESDSLASMNDELTLLVRGDPLTGLGNRRALQEDLDLLEIRVTRYGHRYCIALLDVDNFKSYNDHYGHQAGDDVLQAVASQLTSQKRSGDSVYRYGGDEFLCIFPNQTLESGTIAVERMRRGMENLAIPHVDNAQGVLTISAGVAVMDPGHARSAVDVLKEADEALYGAKELGRNRTGVSTPEPALGDDGKSTGTDPSPRPSD